jgi:hypothetical protein
MKKQFFALLLLASSIQSFASCDTTLDITFFNKPFLKAEDSKMYQKIVNSIEDLGYTVTENKDVRLTTKIEVGIERGDEHNYLLSHVQIINRKGKILFEDHKTRKVADDKIMTADQMLHLTKRQVKKDLPLCD